MKEEFFKELCMDCVKEEIEEMTKHDVDGFMSAAFIISMTAILKRLEKKLKYRGLFD